MNKTVENLRQKYPEFVYWDYFYKYSKPNLKIWFNFKIKSLARVKSLLKLRSEVLVKNVAENRLEKLKKNGLENLVFHLGLIEMLNYWKLTCSPKIIIKAGNLDREQINFLRKIILKGMGQYFYENKIDFTKKDFLKIESNKKKPLFKTSKIKLNSEKYLIPVGGGKDSPVVIEILRDKKKKLGSFVLNPQKPQLDIVKIARLKENIFVERRLDKKLFELNRAGFLNGHVPFSAFLAFLSVILAYIFDYKKVAFGWEKSADEPNLKYKGRWINHQWSKSSEFEKIFYHYAKKYLLKGMEVFSPLRKFSELEISEIFSKLSKYHFAFISCNNAYKTGVKNPKWCGKCPKCLFVFASLYPFLKEKTIKIFGKNLFEDKNIVPIMLELIGEKKHKPFECVGTVKENIKAFDLSLKTYQPNKNSSSKKLPFLLNYFK